MEQLADLIGSIFLSWNNVSDKKSLFLDLYYGNAKKSMESNIAEQEIIDKIKKLNINRSDIERICTMMEIEYSKIKNIKEQIIESLIEYNFMNAIKIFNSYCEENTTPDKRVIEFYNLNLSKYRSKLIRICEKLDVENNTKSLMNLNIIVDAKFLDFETKDMINKNWQKKVNLKKANLNRIIKHQVLLDKQRKDLISYKKREEEKKEALEKQKKERIKANQEADRIKLNKQNELLKALEKYTNRLDLFLSKDDFFSFYDELKNIRNVFGESFATISFYEQKLSEKMTMYLDKPIDKAQAKAIANNADALLIRARAGSGKTRVLAQKIKLLITKYNLEPSDILLLTFNAKPRKDMQLRLSKELDWGEDGEKDLVQTFHSLAAKITGHKVVGWSLKLSTKSLLMKAFGNIKKEAGFQLYLNRIVRKLRFPSMAKYKIIDKGAFDSPEEYKKYRDKLPLITLDNQRVKSMGEKLIADFLFEHDIKYYYETTRWLPKEGILYRPDFHIMMKNDQGGSIYLEHWGILESDLTNPKDTYRNDGIDVYQYINDRSKKLDYWETQPRHTLLETFHSDFLGDKDKFQQIIKTKLEKAIGIKINKLSESEIINRIEKIMQSDLVNNSETVINKKRAYRLSGSEVIRRMNKSSYPDNYSVNEFLEIALLLEKEFVKIKESNKVYDFDNTLELANSLFENGDDSFPLYKKLSQIKYLMIDEFQDFNKLFHDLVKNILKINPKLKIVCVGDDWQAINSFMGSDSKFFENFSTDYKKQNILPEEESLLINYRSSGEIVRFGNSIMRGNGFEAVAAKADLADIVQKDVEEEYIGNSRIFNLTDGNYHPQKKFIKAMHSCIREHIHLFEDSKSKKNKILVLTRKKKFMGNELDHYAEKLKYLFSKKYNELNTKKISEESFDDVFEISTAHSRKGDEAQVVIILGASGGEFPLIHPSNYLFSIFSSSPETYIAQCYEEERRLFYVACTRAKNNLYLLYENGMKSPLIK